MQKPLNNSWEAQLKSKADNFSIKPSAKVWEGVSSQLEEDAIVVGSNLASSNGSSFFSNWMLNILIPAVVLVGSGTMFYFNAIKASKANAELGNVANNQSEVELSKNNNKTTVELNKNDVAKDNPTEKANAVSTILNQSLKSDHKSSDNKNVEGESAIEQSFGYSKSVNKFSSVADNVDSDASTKLGENVFSKADLQKISKKEMEHENPNDIKERNIKSVSF